MQSRGRFPRETKKSVQRAIILYYSSDGDDDSTPLVALEKLEENVLRDEVWLEDSWSNMDFCQSWFRAIATS